MRRPATFVLLLSLLLGLPVPVRPYTVQLTDSSGSMQIRWATRKIPVSLSTSLTSPGPQIKAGSDVVGAARRAMSRWAGVGNVQFVEGFSKAQSISSTASGDGISLITIADTVENSALFSGSSNTGRTRVFYDPSTGAISEADIVINPHPVSADGSPVLFSTDGTPGTYDLESALTHELGHLLGLEHSGVIASTMQARQGLNGLYNLSATTNRTLSEDDRAAERGLYGVREGLGAIEGKVQNSSSGSPTAVFGAHVWAESVQTGRVIASSITLSDGTYRIEGLSPGQYRVIAGYLDGAVMAADIASSGGAYAGMVSQAAFRSEELAAQLNVNAGAATTLNRILVPLGSAPALKPRLLGLNAQLSSVAIPVEAGRSYTIYIGGEGVDQVPGSAITVSSPFVTVSPASLALQPFGTSFPVISFEVTVAPNAPFGDYSIRLQGNSGEVAYLAGGLTVDPGVNAITPNPADDDEFFVRQQYRDFLARDADHKGLEYWTTQLAICGVDAACLRDQRVDVSAAFFGETEFQERGAFVYRLYKSALGRRPGFAEFSADSRQVVAGANLEGNKQALVQAFSERGEFTKAYPAVMNGEQFVDALLATVARNSQVDLYDQRSQLLSLFQESGDAGRARVIRQIAEDESFARSEYNQAFVLMQYFAYLRRDPDPRGLEFWLNVLNSKATNDASAHRSMICSFLSSTEYQSRFGMVMTHTNAECGP